MRTSRGSNFQTGPADPACCSGSGSCSSFGSSERKWLRADADDAYMINPCSEGRLLMFMMLVWPVLVGVTMLSFAFFGFHSPRPFFAGVHSGPRCSCPKPRRQSTAKAQAQGVFTACGWRGEVGKVSRRGCRSGAAIPRRHWPWQFKGQGQQAGREGARSSERAQTTGASKPRWRQHVKAVVQTAPGTLQAGGQT